LVFIQKNVAYSQAEKRALIVITNSRGTHHDLSLALTTELFEGKNAQNSDWASARFFLLKIEEKIRGEAPNRVKSIEMNGAGGGNRTHGLGIMRPSLFH
jgi:hypothetical protein